MIYRRMGRSGLRLSVFSLGAWVTFGHNVRKSVARRCIDAALDRGVNFLDNAESYGGGRAEEVVGEILVGRRREDLVLSSKVFWGGEGPNDEGLSRKRVHEACHAALRRLRTDYLDLYFCHRPDPGTPIEETVRAMDVLIRQGKVLYWGTSEWPAEAIEEAFRLARELHLTPPSVEQPQYNMFHRERVEREYAPLYERHGLGTTVYSPLASGLLTGKYDRGVPWGSRLSFPHMGWLKDTLLTEENRARAQALAPVADALGCTRAQLALAWAAKNPRVSSVITGASRPSQVEENLGALDVLSRLDDTLMARIDAILAGG